METLDTKTMKANLEADLKKTLQSIEVLKQRALKLQGALEVMGMLEAKQEAPVSAETDPAAEGSDQKVEG